MSRPQAVPPEAVRSSEPRVARRAPRRRRSGDPYASVRAEDAPRHPAGRDGDRQRHREREPDAQAGPDLRHAQEPGEEGRLDLRRRHAGSAARRLRLPALARHLVPREHRRHLRLAVADPPLQPAHRRLDRGRDPHAEGRRALLRAGQGRQGQRRGPRGGQEQDPVREPDAAASGQGVQARARDQGRREHHRARPRHRRADRQGPARADRLAAQGRQDGDAAAHRARAGREPPRDLADRAADRRAARGSDRNVALGARRSGRLHLRRAGQRATCRSPRW